MIIDRSHLALAKLTAVLAAAGLMVYVVGRMRSPEGFSAGSLEGLALGLAGTACMVLAGLLPARKRAAARQPARPAKSWLRWHLWFGLLSGPLILLHAGFRLGGTLEQALMGVFVVVYFSGVVGAALQHFLPRAMTSLSPRQAIADQLEVGCQRLVLHADRLVTERCGSLLQWAAGGGAGGSYGAEQARQFYCEQVRPFLGYRGGGDKVRMDNPHAAEQLFEEQRLSAPAELHGLLEQLATICSERRDMRLQQRLQWWLHSWLMLHVPLSAALLVLGAAHIVMSLRYLY